ncbi:glutathione synthetase-like [Hydra vulgaris]|uniref:Glutathione synthetase n=1 Tax=Hydra vulgaris TaxID=6087 RepID=A0ABM4DPB9_HYDVU
MDIYENLKLDEAEINELADTAKDWVTLHGMIMRNNNDRKLLNYAPFMLFPSPFPRYLYEEAFSVQADLQELVYKASCDHEFIYDALKSVIVHDEFTRKQFEIYDQVRKEGIKQKYVFNITRSDYMINELKNPDENKRLYDIKQIEMNMIAASFGGLGTFVEKLHRYMCDVMGESAPFKKDQVATNSAIKNLGKGMAKLWKIYDKEDSVVIFVVQNGERNRFDQRLLEYNFQESVQQLGAKKHVPVLFRSLEQIHKYGKINDDRTCFVEGHEVALFYFRATYTPNDYTSPECWEARLMIERSTAAKCPSMAENLIGTKKVQQVFAKPGMVERFVNNPEVVKKIRKTFAGLYSLDETSEGDAAAEMALGNPSNYVLKPQREGGGNNMYDSDMVDELKRVTATERSQYILMERIQPPSVKNYMVHVNFDRAQLTDTVTELGIFGVLIAVDGVIVHNEPAGHLMRTKSKDQKDGGVAAGVAVLDTPYLI